MPDATSTPPVAAIAQQFDGAHQYKNGWRAKCPVHQGNSSTSLHLWEEAGQLRWHCFAGCDSKAVYDALRLPQVPRTPKYQAIYTYHDASGYTLFQVVRSIGDKRFFQRRPHPSDPGKWINDMKGVDKVIYRLPEVMKAIMGGLPIYVVEGEKDVETLRAHGLAATCNPGGAGKWEDRYSEALRNATIILLPDNDAAGRKHADLVTTRLQGYVQRLHRIELPDLPERGDVTDWLDAGHTIEDLQALTATKAPSITAPHMVVVSFEDVADEHIEWLWQPYIPLGKLTIVEGDPGLGKTFFLLAVATALSCGTGLPASNGQIMGGVTDPRTTLYLTAEDGYGDTLKPRATKMQANLRYLKAVYGWTADEQVTHPFSLDHLTLLEEAIRDFQASLVILDPLSAFLGAQVDMHRANEVRPLLMQLGHMAARQRCAVVVVRHWNKNVGGKATYRGQGSIDFTAAARSVLALGESPDDPSIRILAQSKNSLTAKGVSQCFQLLDDAFTWMGKSELDAESLAAVQPNKRQLQRHNAMQWLKEYLSTGPQLATMIRAAAEALSIPYRTLERAKAALGILSSKEDKGWYWRLPHFEPWDRYPGMEEDDED